MLAKSPITRGDNYRSPSVRVVVDGHDTSEKEDAEEEEEWTDDSDLQESSNSFRHSAPPFNHHSYGGNFDGLQNRMVGRVKTRPTPDYSPYTHDPEYGRYLSGDSARAFRRHSNMSYNSPGGQAVPYGGSYPNASSFAPCPRQQNPNPQYYPPHSQYIPPPPQFYPSADPEIARVRQELEDIKLENMEKERRGLEKKQAEENRRKKKRAELQQKRKAKQQEEAQKIAFEAKMQQMKADFDKRLENVSKAPGHHDQTADLYGILRNLLPPQPAPGHYGHDYGYNAQDKQAHDMSVIMRRLDSLAALERQAPPPRWYDGQGPSIRYRDDRPLADDLRIQIDDMKRHLYHYEQIINALLPRRQRSAGQLADGEYHPPDGPHPTLRSLYSPAASSSSNQPGHPRLIRQSRKARAGGRRKNYSGREPPSSSSSDDDFSDGENLASAVVAGHIVDEHQQAANTSKKMRKRQPPSHEKPEASENNNATRDATDADADGEEYGADSGHTSDASDELEAFKHRPNQYARKPDPRFRREALPSRGRHSQPSDQFPYSVEDHAPRVLAPSPPPLLGVNGDSEGFGPCT